MRLINISFTTLLGLLFSSNAGFVSGIALVCYLDAFVGVFTGNITFLSTLILEHKYKMIAVIFILLLAYVIGVFVGQAIENIFNKKKALIITAIIHLLVLTIAIPLINEKNIVAQYLLAASLGLQNVIVFSFNNGIGCSFITGTLTKGTMECAKVFSRGKQGYEKAFQNLFIVLFFFIGANVGVILYSYLLGWAIIFAGILTLFQWYGLYGQLQ